MFSGVTSGRVLDGERLYTKILEFNLFAFAYRLFHEDFYEKIEYCKSTNFGVLLYLANLANCVISPIFVAANTYVDRTLHRRAAERRQI